ncbi:MAG: PASTA domain-containing protein [Bacteroidota bacterium]
MKERLQLIGKEIAAFFTSPVVLKNLGVLVVSLIALLFMTQLLLKSCTRHGESMQVQDFTGMDLNEATQKAKRDKLRIMVLDSMDRGTNPPNMVLSQDPVPYSRVKKNRTIYLTTTRVTREKTKTPPISERDNYNDYKRALKVRTLEAAIKEEKADNRYLPGTILDVYHDNKKLSFDEIDEGYELEKGSTLEFVVTKFGIEYVAMPNVACETFMSAETRLRNANLVVGIIREDVTVVDRNSAYVYKSVPAYEPNKQLQVGEQINLFLTQNLPEACGGEAPIFEENTDL